VIILPSKEPLFASNVQRKGKFLVYFDHEGMQACCNFTATSKFRQCVICGNNCVQFIVDDDTGEYTCSACGKFPREVLLQ
jgi:hypothetical protein